MGLFKRILGICETQPPQDSDGWSFKDGNIEIDFSRVKELGVPGGAIRLEGKGLPQRVLVFKGNDGAFHAFMNKCSHGGRRLDPVQGEDKVRCCSLGRSTMDYQGKVLSGPAKHDITTYAVQQTKTHLKVVLG